ncbi:autophagy-related protein 22-like protein [Gigaspora rosea]|uniref:Autophagy-related protein n=1 Tax=Gigaspora rosea TaxID=44941 RepID=A0A397U4D3_9GLOM|nr:autophagy-related protein 22-like protein [Gigaspora rosea]
MNLENSEEEKSPSIENEELTPITKKEFVGWYILSAANGIYGGAPIGVLIPLFLETIAGQAGYELDRITPCNTTVANYNCVVRFGTGFISTESYSLYIISISVIVQTVLFISCGSLADHGKLQKMFALLYAFIGATATILFIAVTSPQLYLLAGVFAIISNCCYGAANIFSGAYIPIFSRNHPKVIEARNSNVPIIEIKKLEDEMTVNLSSHSLVVAIFTAMLVMFSTGAILILTNGSSYGTQLALVFAGSCWLILLIFPTIWLTSRSKPPLPVGEHYLLYSWKRVGKTLLSTRSLWQTMKFLFAWFLISDGVSTLVVVGILFSKKHLEMTDTEIILMTSLVPVFEIIGIYLFFFLQKLFHMTDKTIIIITSIFSSILPLYVILGFWLPFGLNNRWEVWLYLLWFGISIGTIFNYYRALFSIMIPIGHENEFFLCFRLLQSIASGIIINYTHDIRSSFWFLLAVIAFPVLIFCTVNVEKGKEEAEKYPKRENVDNS